MGSTTQDLVLATMRELTRKGTKYASAREIYDEIRSHGFDIPIQALRNALYYMEKVEIIIGDNYTPHRVPRRYALKKI